MRIVLNFVSGFRKCLIALGMRYVDGTRRFASFDQSSCEIVCIRKNTFIFKLLNRRERRKSDSF